MLRPNRPGWLAISLILFVAACNVPAGGTQAVTAVGELPTATTVAQTKAIPTTRNAGTVEKAPLEKTPTRTARPRTTPPEVEAALAETPADSVVDPTTEVRVTAMATPSIVVEAELEDVAPNHAETEPGPTEEQLELLAGLENFGSAPELHNEVWLNSEPLELGDLRGKVVMVEFWTFG